MPSASLVHWQNERTQRLVQIDVQCTTAVRAVPPNAHLIDESLRGYALLLSAHFQGFCRDLYTECGQIIVSKVRPKLQVLIQAQFTAHRALDHGNPNLDHIRTDFERFGFRLDLASADPANPARLTHLGRLNRWRNAAAHHGTVPPGIPLDLPSLQGWRGSCNGLAASLDAVMYNQLQRILRRAPW